MRFPWRFVLVIAALMADPLLLAACGGDEGAGRIMPMFRGNPARTGVNPGPSVEHSPKLLWRFVMDDMVDFSPAAVHGVVYVVSVHGHVNAIH